MLGRFDDWLLDEHFQKWANAVHDRFGITHVWMACLFYILASAACWIGHQTLPEKLFPYLWVVSLLLLTAALFCVGMDFINRNARFAGLMNSDRLEYARSRKTFLIVIPALTAITLLNKATHVPGFESGAVGWPICGAWLFVVGLYFTCCTTTPRKKKEVSRSLAVAPSKT